MEWFDSFLGTVESLLGPVRSNFKVLLVLSCRFLFINSFKLVHFAEKLYGNVHFYVQSSKVEDEKGGVHRRPIRIFNVGGLVTKRHDPELPDNNAEPINNPISETFRLISINPSPPGSALVCRDVSNADFAEPREVEIKHLAPLPSNNDQTFSSEAEFNNFRFKVLDKYYPGTKTPDKSATSDNAPPSSPRYDFRGVNSPLFLFE